MSSKTILAKFDDKTIRVYQAYSDVIADEAIKLQTFGNSFKLERMTWIKPSFLWMMYRSRWATKIGQERVLAIDIIREGFDEMLSNAVLSSFNLDIYKSYNFWKEQLTKSEIICQWDPDRDIYGNPLDRRAIQIGIKEKMVIRYIEEWIVNIFDITSNVIDWRTKIKEGTFKDIFLPETRIYPINENTQKILGMKVVAHQ